MTTKNFPALQQAWNACPGTSTLTFLTCGPWYYHWEANLHVCNMDRTLSSLAGAINATVRCWRRWFAFERRQQLRCASDIDRRRHERLTPPTFHLLEQWSGATVAWTAWQVSGVVQSLFLHRDQVFGIWTQCHSIRELCGSIVMGGHVREE